MRRLRREKKAIRMTLVVLLVSMPDFSNLLDDSVSIIVGSSCPLREAFEISAIDEATKRT